MSEPDSGSGGNGEWHGPDPVDPGITPGRTLAIVTLFAAGGLYLVVGTTLPLLNVAIGLWFSSVFVFFATPFELLRLSGREPVRYLGLRVRPWKSLAAGGLVGVLNYFGFVAPLQLLSKRFVEPLVPKWLSQDLTSLFDASTPLELALIGGAVTLAAPFCEEVMFRGTVQQALAEKGGRIRALWITSIIFSAFHFDAVGFLARMELGFLFGLMVFASGSIWPGVMAHAANNAVSLGLYFVARKASLPLEEELPPLLYTLAWAGLGGACVVAVLRASLTGMAQRAPEELASPVPPERRPRSLLRPMVRWGAAGAVVIAILFGVDRRGIELNVIDVRHPLSREAVHKRSPEREALRQLRKDARAGRLPVEVYAAHRKARSLQERGEDGAQRNR